MTHAFAANLRQGHLDSAFLADNASILHPLVFAAQALIVLDRPENAGAEQPITLWLEGSVVNGLRLLDFTERPGANSVWAGDRNLDLIEALRAGRLAKKVHQLVHRVTPGFKRCIILVEGAKLPSATN